MGPPSSLHRFRLQRDSCLFVCLFFCRWLSSVSCWRGCLRFAKRCSLCSAVCCCLLLRCWKIFSGEDFQPVGESSVVMLAFVAFNCSLFTNGNHCFADAEQTTLSHELKTTVQSIDLKPFSNLWAWSHIGWRQYAVANLLLGNCVRRNRCDREKDLWPKQDHSSIGDCRARWRALRTRQIYKPSTVGVY